jgi:hypothetical protein
MRSQTINRPPSWPTLVQTITGYLIPTQSAIRHYTHISCRKDYTEERPRNNPLSRGCNLCSRPAMTWSMIPGANPSPVELQPAGLKRMARVQLTYQTKESAFVHSSWATQPENGAMGNTPCRQLSANTGVSVDAFWKLNAPKAGQRCPSRLNDTKACDSSHVKYKHGQGSLACQCRKAGLPPQHVRSRCVHILVTDTSQDLTYVKERVALPMHRTLYTSYRHMQHYDPELQHMLGNTLTTA